MTLTIILPLTLKPSAYQGNLAARSTIWAMVRPSSASHALSPRPQQVRLPNSLPHSSAWERKYNYSR